MIDNNPISYALNVDNGIPIKSWYDDYSDLELTNLLPILEFLAYSKDVKKHIPKFIVNNNVSYQEAFNIICTANDEGDRLRLDSIEKENRARYVKTTENNEERISLSAKKVPNSERKNPNTTALAYDADTSRDMKLKNNASNLNQSSSSKKPVTNISNILKKNSDRSVNQAARPSTGKSSSSNTNKVNTSVNKKQNKTFEEERKTTYENHVTNTDKSININIINNHINNYIIGNGEKNNTSINENQDRNDSSKKAKVNPLNSFRTNFADENKKDEYNPLQLSYVPNKTAVFGKFTSNSSKNNPTSSKNSSNNKLNNFLVGSNNYNNSNSSRFGSYLSKFLINFINFRGR